MMMVKGVFHQMSFINNFFFLFCKIFGSNNKVWFSYFRIYSYFELSLDHHTVHLYRLLEDIYLELNLNHEIEIEVESTFTSLVNIDVLMGCKMMHLNLGSQGPLRYRIINNIITG